jgi:hypothetical protein
MSASASPNATPASGRIAFSTRPTRSDSPTERRCDHPTPSPARRRIDRALQRAANRAHTGASSANRSAASHRPNDAPRRGPPDHWIDRVRIRGSIAIALNVNAARQIRGDIVDELHLVGRRPSVYAPPAQHRHLL